MQIRLPISLRRFGAAAAVVVGAFAAAGTAYANPGARSCYYEYYIVTGDSVTLRAAPGSSTVYKRLGRGDVVERHHSNGAWHYVTHDGRSGWILAEYARFSRSTRIC